MKEIWYFLYRDYESAGRIFSSIHYDTFEKAWESLKYIAEGCNSAEPVSPVMKGYVKDE